MNFNHQELPLDNIGQQSPGCDPKSAKRNSGLFSFFKWFKPSSTSRESINTINSSSCDSLNSIQSNGTVASFSYVPPSAYNNRIVEKCIILGPETDTYKARLKQRDKRRENDKNLTLRKKYNLFFNRETLLKNLNATKANKDDLLDEETGEEEENTKSLPLMTRTTMDQLEPEKIHRRTNSESSKIKRAGAYLHVKGKRRAPQPPPSGLKQINDNTLSLRRKKRLAPAPPPQLTNEKILNGLNEYGTIQYADADIIFNDSLKLDHGILKSTKSIEIINPNNKTEGNNDQNSSKTPNSPNTSARSSYIEAPVSPRPWYKRNSNYSKKDNKYEPIERLPEVQFIRNSTIDLSTTNDNKNNKKDDKRKSGLSFLTNISELDREASEIIKKAEKNPKEITEMPQFMRPKEEPIKVINSDTLVSPKRRSARDLIAKFNAITNVTKVTVNSAFFGNSQKESKRDYFGKQISLNDDQKKVQENLLENHKKKLQQIDYKLKADDNKFHLMKSESASAIKVNKPETPKIERKSWNCPKCSIENDYWRIICHVCSTIKPYFDDLTSSSSSSSSSSFTKISSNKEVDKTSSKETAIANGSNKETNNNNNSKNRTSPEKLFERSKTQIGFSILANYNANLNKKIEKSVSLEENTKQETDSKKEEREKLKKMLIEMKNSLPKRKSNILVKQNSRTSVIMENPENNMENEELKKPKTAEIINLPKTTTEDNKKIEAVPIEKDKTVKTEEKTQEEKVASILVGTTETIYENIKVRKTDNPKPIKVSASAQTNSVITKTPEISKSVNKTEIANTNNKTSYEPMKPKDFETIYSDTNGQTPARIYANLAQNDDLSLFFNVPKNLSEIKNISKNAVVDNATDTIEINRLLKRLESAIAKGELTQASIYAKELAQLKINCSVIRQIPAGQQSKTKKQGFTIEMFVEDKISHRGPFPIEVTANQTVAELKLQVQTEFDIPVNVQRWILGKELASDDNASLKDHNITEGCPVFLYLVAPPEPKTGLEMKYTKIKNDVEKPTTSKTDKELVNNLSGFGKEELLGVEKNVPQLASHGSKTTNDAVVVDKITKTEKEGKISPPKIVKVIPKEPRASESLKVATEDTPIKKVSELSPIKQTPANSVSNDSSVKKITEISPVRRVSEGSSSKGVTETSHIRRVSEGSSSKNTTGVLSTSGGVSIKENHEVSLIKKVPERSSIGQIVENSSQKNNEIKLEGKINLAKAEKVEARVTKTDIKLEITENKIKINNEKRKEDMKIPVALQSSSSSSNHVRTTSSHQITTSTDATFEDFEDYDSKTLKPQPKEWECRLCTLLNPITSNICAVCNAVRVKEETGHTPRKSTKTRKAPQPSSSKDQTYLQLVNLDNTDLVENSEPFECVVCFMEIAPGHGVTLRECLHQFCKLCLAHTVEYTEDAEVKCPYRDENYSCNIALQDREIKALVTPTVYEQYLAKSVAQAENKIGKSFHCKTPDCNGWCIFEDNVNEFKCPVCRRINCLTCQAIHVGMNCKQYQEKMNTESEVDENAKRTSKMLDEMVSKGEALTCPTCQVILMKKWGCDWLRCSMCKTEICWVTRGPRWGPAGKGDTSGGCQCGVNGVKCHPQCNYCH